MALKEWEEAEKSLQIALNLAPHEPTLKNMAQQLADQRPP
jgi:hypothetical protein